MDQPVEGVQAVHRISEAEFHTRLGEILRMTRDGGSFLVVSGEHVLAELHPPSQLAPKGAARVPGGLEGKIIMAPDFDTLPDDVLDAFEGRHA